MRFSSSRVNAVSGSFGIPVLHIENITNSFDLYRDADFFLELEQSKCHTARQRFKIEIKNYIYICDYGHDRKRGEKCWEFVRE